LSAILGFISTNYLLFIALGAFLAALAFYRFVGVARIAAWTTRRPWTTICAAALAVGLLGIGVKGLEIDGDVTSVLPEGIPSQAANDRIEASLGSVDRVYVLVEAKRGTIWRPEILRKVKALSDELAAAPYADKVISLSESKDARNEDDSLVIGNMMEGVPETEAEIADLRGRLRANLVLGRRLVSADDTATVIGVLLKDLGEGGADGSRRGKKLSESEICAPDPKDPDKPTLGNIKRRYEGDDISVSFSGLPYLRYETSSKMSSDMSLFLPASIAIMLAFLFLCFRSLRGMLLPFSVVVSSLLGLYGLMGWLGERMYIPYVIIGPMFVAIAHNYGTQLVASYYETVRGSTPAEGRPAIARKSVVAMGSPILLSAATVVIGFLSMLGHPLPAMAKLGYFSAFGITLAFVLTIVLTPAILSLLPPPARASAAGQDAAVDKALAAIARFVVRYKYAVLASTAALLVGCALLIPLVRVDSNAIGYYRKDSAVYRTFATMGEKFAGAMTINVLLDSDDPVAPDSPEDGVMKAPSALRWMESFQSYAESIADPRSGKRLVGDSSSLADQVAYMNSVMQGSADANAVPDDAGLVAQYLLLTDQDDISNYVDSKFNAAQVVIQLPEMDTRSVSAVIEALRERVAADPPPGFSVSLGGSVTSVYEINELLLRGQVDTLILSVAIIVLCYMLVFRSVAAGLLASVPLVVAILVVFGMMAAFGINLDTVTSILTGIMIGAGTDYTAYFLWRMRELSGRCASLEEAYAGTMGTIGKGIVYNGLSVVVGFVVFFWSNFLPVVFFGALISVSIFICVVGALTVLPAAVIIARPRFLEQRSKV
jgi:uncharacterized protein